MGKRIKRSAKSKISQQKAAAHLLPKHDPGLSSTDCPACPQSKGGIVGMLGNTVHYRCRDCGIGFFREIDCTSCKHSSDNNGNCMGCNECDDDFSSWELVDVYT
jgi:hypothetical protein